MTVYGRPNSQETSAREETPVRRDGIRFAGMACFSRLRRRRRFRAKLNQPRKGEDEGEVSVTSEYK